MPHQSVRKTNLLLLAKDTRVIFQRNKLIALYPSIVFNHYISNADGNSITKHSKEVRYDGSLLSVSQ